MSTLNVEVPEKIAKNFSKSKIIKYDDLLDYQDNLKYKFSDEKVTLEELNDFLGKSIASKKSSLC